MSKLSQLTMLAVLDVQNNAIASVPPELGKLNQSSYHRENKIFFSSPGNLTQIRSLQLEGNMFRVPRPAILAQGTPAVMSYLRDRIPQ